MSATFTFATFGQTAPVQEDQVDPATISVVQESPAAATAPAAEATTQPTTAPTTAPAVSKRLDKFLKVKFGRTPQSAMKAMSERPAQDADEAAIFQSNVLAGRWDAVGKTIASFEPAEAKQLYAYVVHELGGTSPPGAGVSQPPQARSAAAAQLGTRTATVMRTAQGAVLVPGPRRVVMGGPGAPGAPGGPGAQGAPGGASTPSFLLPQDVLAVMSASPSDIDDALIDPLGQLLGPALARANVTEPVVAELENGIHGVGGTGPKARLRAANLLFAASRPVEAGKFLPPLNPNLSANEPRQLDLHSKHLAAVAAQDADATAARDRAWAVTLALLNHPKASAQDRETAMTRALELLPRLTKEASRAWLKEDFTQRPEQGMAVLASVGSSLAQNFMNRDVNAREHDLEQQRTVVDQLLAHGGNDTQRWSPALNVLATIWLQEADYSKQRPSRRQMQSSGYGRTVVYGPYGPEIQQQPQFMGNQNEPPPVDSAKLLETGPTEAWIALLEPSLRAPVRADLAQLQFKEDEPEKALPQIEALASLHRKLARDLGNDLLNNLARVWDANQNNRNYNNYYYSGGGYSYMQSGIPLTRSAQVRNIAQLASTLRKLEKLPIERPERSAIVNAFASAHSSAEVFRTEDIETVFGPGDSINRDTLFDLLQTMRQRLATSWRSPNVQQQAKTKRTDKELDAEVTRGYTLITQMLEKRLAKEQDWKLMTGLASAQYEWAEFDYGKQVELAVYTARRDHAFELFHKAADLYKAALPSLKESDRSPLVYEQWFNATLGASDLAALTRQAQPSPTQIEQVRQALFSIPGELGEKHLDDFGHWLSDAVNTLKPELKHRFLKAGVQVVGGRDSAKDARKLVQYYDDLLTEVELHAAVDGDPLIGHTKPFGLHVSIRHTEAVGRESGGFNKYLTNQQSARYYYNPSGQGPVNYRDDFEKKIRKALSDRFEIRSIAWYDEKIEPRGYGKFGWRETPLAYVLLKPKDASVDKVPAVQLDLDFFDQRGTVILPVSTQVLLVDARPDNALPRPLSNVEITQILDQRDAASGKLSLDIKAGGTGLLPELGDLLKLDVPGFTIDKVTDQGLSIAKMDTEGDKLAPISERSWLVNLSPARSASASEAAVFHFPAPLSKATKVNYKRYADADVADVDPQLAVAGLPLAASHRWMWIAGTLLVALLIASAVALLMIRRRARLRRSAPAPAFSLPHTITPFTVLDLLRRMERDAGPGLSGSHREQLTREILQLQERFFAPTSNGDTPPDLSAIASRWVTQVR
jgi:hypothetical protein